MERLDFASITQILRSEASEGRFLSQMEFADALLFGCLESEDIHLDMGQLNRTFNGLVKLSPRIINYYQIDKDHLAELTASLRDTIVPELADPDMALRKVHDLLIQDPSISERKKTELDAGYPCETESDAAEWLTKLLMFGMERPFQARDVRKPSLSPSGSLSPVLADYVVDEGLPELCSYFCGREKELSALREVLVQNRIVFVQGAPGIGKSELVKAYAKANRKNYTNILYITYTGSLKQNIAALYFADDRTEDDEEALFRKHNRFLRTLKEDTLLIIDNFDVDTSRDELLDVVLKYHCRIIFTTRNSFDGRCIFPVEEINDSEQLFHLAAQFYSDAAAHRDEVVQIIEAVHRNTFAVELAARLLETGILEPAVVLDKLRVEGASFDAADKIHTAKDGKRKYETYYTHIHKLFALFRLSASQKEIMRNLTLVPLSGVPARLLGEWMLLRDLNDINDIVEMGFVQMKKGRRLSLHPMMKEVTISELPPSVTACFEMLHSIRIAQVLHGTDLPEHKLMFQVIENTVSIAAKDDTVFYFLVLQDVFTQMVGCHYEKGLRLLLGEMEQAIQDPAVGTDYNHAILFNCKAAYAQTPKEKIRLLQKALAHLPEVTIDNARLAANINANLGSQYRMDHKFDAARTYMETAESIMQQYHLFDSHDGLIQSVNYAVLLGEMGETDRGLKGLHKLERLLKHEAPGSSDHALILEVTGSLHLIAGNILQATEHYLRALQMYSVIWSNEPQLLKEKHQEICDAYAQVGIPVPIQITRLPDGLV